MRRQQQLAAKISKVTAMLPSDGTLLNVGRKNPSNGDAMLPSEGRAWRALDLAGQRNVR